MLNLKLALRTLWKTPFVTLVAILSLGLGIGANSAIFSLFEQVLLRSLPVQEPGQLVNLAAPGPKPGSQSCTGAGGCDEVFSYPMFLDLQEQQSVFTDIAAHVDFGANLAFEGETVSGGGMLVSGSYFPTLGLRPAEGRLLDHNDTKVIGESRVVVLSYEYWQDRFGGDKNVLNKSLVVNGHPMTIVGVAPVGFNGTTLGSSPEVFLPISLRADLSPWFDAFDNRRSYWAYVFGRLKPDVTMEAAATGINVPYQAIINEVEADLQEGMSPDTLERFRAKKVLLAPGYRGQSSMQGESKVPLFLLFGVATVVLLIACANVANLLLARSATRTGEMAVRLSVGASQGKLIGQLLLEACLLAAFGGVAGIVVAHWTLILLGRILPSSGFLEFSINPQVIAFTGVLALLTGILFGLFPALHSTKTGLATVLRQVSGQSAGARTAARFRTALVITQIALSTALLVSAGLFTQSLTNIKNVDLGMETENLITFSIAPLLNGYSNEESMNFFVRAEEELQAIPGVTAVTASLVPIIAGSSWGTDVAVQGFERGPDIDDNSRYNEVGPGFLSTLGTPLIAGREFTESDVVGSAKVAIVNEAFAEKFGLGRDVVGKFMSNDTGLEELDMEIVGFVQNSKYNSVKGNVPPVFMLPYRQSEDMGFINFYVRTAITPEDTMAAVTGVMRRLDANLPLDDLKTMEKQVNDNVFLDRFITTLSAAFAALATILAAIGLYGVLAFTVAQRTREIGLRMALGANTAKVRLMVIKQLGGMTLIGGVLGIAAAIGIGNLASSQLFEVQGHDPLTLIRSALLLGVIALLAGLLPAQRAARVDPMIALRYE